MNIVKESERMASVIMISFSVGFRFMYIAISLTFYAAGLIALNIATGIMLIILYLNDRAW